MHQVIQTDLLNSCCVSSRPSTKGQTEPFHSPGDVICAGYDRRKASSTARSEEESLNGRPRLSHQVRNLLIMRGEKPNKRDLCGEEEWMFPVPGCSRKEH